MTFIQSLRKSLCLYFLYIDTNNMSTSYYVFKLAAFLASIISFLTATITA